MKTEEILEKIRAAKKGRYVALCKYKDLGEGITKETDMVIRLGVHYANMSINDDRVTQSLPWGHWVEGLEDLVIEHTKVDKKTNEATTSYYLRVTATDPEHPERCADVIATRYMRDGMIISKEEVEKILPPKALGGNASPVYNIKFENILSLSI